MFEKDKVILKIYQC